MSLYRVSTANSYDLTLNNINKRNNELSTTQQRLSSGKRVMKASDDAVAATLAERSQNRLARVEADKRSLENARTSLTQAESALGQATDIIHRARELMVQAGNPVLTQAMRSDLADQLEAMRTEMLSVANQTDTAGLPLFGGLGGASNPFFDQYGPNAGVVFNGQAGQYLPTERALPTAMDGHAIFMTTPQGNGSFLPVLDPGNAGSMTTSLGAATELIAPFDTSLATPNGLGVQVAIESDGSGGTNVAVYAVTARNSDGSINTVNTTTPLVAPTPYTSGETLAFGGTSGGAIQIQLNGTPQVGDEVDLQPVLNQPGNIFDTMQRAINSLRNDSGADLTQNNALTLQELDSSLDRILAGRGRLGEWLNRADSMGANFDDRQVFYEKEQSDLTDLDLVKGISEFQTQQTSLQAALSSYSQVQKLSLFQYIA